MSHLNYYLLYLHNVSVKLFSWIIRIGNDSKYISLWKKCFVWGSLYVYIVASVVKINLYSSPNKLTVVIFRLWGIRWAMHAARIGAMRNLYKGFVRKREVKSYLHDLSHILEDNIKIYLRQTGWKEMIGFILLMIVWNGGLLWTRKQIVGSVKYRGFFD